MKKRKVSSLILFVLFFFVVICGVSVAQAEEDDGFTAMWRIGASGLFRQGNDDMSLVNDNGGVELVNAKDVNLGIAPGLDATVGGRYRMFGVEVRYLGLHEWSSSHDTSSANGAWVWYQNPIGNLGVNLLDIEYDSKLHNVEVNLRWWPFERLSILAGFRYLMLNEDLTIEQNIGPGFILTHEIETDNTLLGAQGGIEGVILRFKNVFFEGDAVNLGGSTKVGYFNNHMKTDIAITPTTWAADESDDEGTFVCEGVLDIGYTITKNIVVQVRYQVLWIQNVLLAPEQVRESNPGFGMASMETENVFYHGPWVGLSISF